MLEDNKKISLKQAMILYLLWVLAPTIRVAPQAAAAMAGKAAWLMPVVASIPGILLIFILARFFKTDQGSLADILCKTLGNAVGRIVMGIYLFQVMLQLIVALRFYAERVLSTILPNVSILMLGVIMLVVVYFVARGGLVSFARLGQLLFGIIMVVFALHFVLALFNVKLENLYPVVFQDVADAALGSYTIAGVWGNVVLVMFLGRQIVGKDQMKKHGLRAMLTIGFVTLILLITVVGILGSSVAARIPMPFFMMVKNLSFFGIIERFDAFILSLWIGIDFMQITLLAIIAKELFGRVFKMRMDRQMITPILLFMLCAFLFIARDKKELENLSSDVLMPIQLTMEFAVPVLVFIVGKIRKKI